RQADVPAQGGARGSSAASPVDGRADAGWVGRIASTIRANTSFATIGSVSGNPRAFFVVTLQPQDCSVVDVKLRRSSGVPAWDLAAQRAIERTDPFPRPPDGRPCPRELEVSHAPHG
ncbi:MAG TPA: energy transducer TonB, partial [Burkholderiaceae bacterium]|nr:energy transducer TonB [Burkholderiaceae bacterium]